MIELTDRIHFKVQCTLKNDFGRKFQEYWPGIEVSAPFVFVFVLGFKLEYHEAKFKPVY